MTSFHIDYTDIDVVGGRCGVDLPCSCITVMLLVVDAALTCIIVAKVPYTEIDWRAYMQEVEGVCDIKNAANTTRNAIAHVCERKCVYWQVIGGEYDYSKLRGDTGPLVYPGGFVWVYMGLREVTNDGKDIVLAQRIFVVIYLLTQVYCVM
jgi:alpha-1,3-mannosyltransferase